MLPENWDVLLDLLGSGGSGGITKGGGYATKP